MTLDGQVESFMIGYNYYTSYEGSDQKSGAYIFRPASDTANKYSNIKAIHYAEGVKSVVFALDGDKTSTKLFFSKEDGYVNKYGF